MPQIVSLQPPPLSASKVLLLEELFNSGQLNEIHIKCCDGSMSFNREVMGDSEFVRLIRVLGSPDFPIGSTLSL